MVAVHTWLATDQVSAKYVAMKILTSQFSARRMTYNVEWLSQRAIDLSEAGVILTDFGESFMLLTTK